ncbi:MAG TPA: ABC transporter permease [Solirubrobacterales bacterium]|nr:ABC transporter permease [Solirubrobacterales bacterium]
MTGRASAFAVVAFAALAVALCFLTFPVVAVFADTGVGNLLDALGEEDAREALWLSLRTSLAAIAIIVLVGTPAAWFLATRDFRGRAAVLTLIELPLVMPPAIAGIGLLAAFGPNGILGGALEDAGIRLVLETAGVIVALVFVAAPFFLRQAQATFSDLDPEVVEASRTLGAGEARTFIAVAVPAARGGLTAGLALAWGRALGEFGATLMFAGSFPGITQTAPLAIFAEFNEDFTAALALSAVLIAVSAALLLTVKLAAGRDAFGGRG